MAPKRRRTGRSRTKKEDTSDIEDELPARPPRPFIESEGLPLSREEPEYAILNNALSLKDSAVLYSSLMKSRKAYTNGSVFDLYWAKGKTKLENDSNARDRMNKLNDCVMDLGPHTYEVRFFILKDEEIEKKRDEEKERKKAKRIASKKAREEKQKLRQVRKANKDDPNSAAVGISNDSSSSAGLLGSPTVAKDSQSKDGKTEENKDDDNDEDDQEEEEEEDDEEEEEEEEEEEADGDDEVEEKSDLASEVQSRERTPQVTSDTPTVATPGGVKPRDEEPEASTTSRSQSKPEEGTSQTKPLPPLQVNSLKSDATKATPPKTTSRESKLTQQDSAPSDPMQTPESQMMIANLNAIARADPSLNALMKIVATGNARPEQIREFQGYIQRAKTMGPSPYFRQQYPDYQAPTFKEPKVKKEKPLKPPKKPKPPKEKQLTTFQELYVNGADLVFEFSENPNVRYNLPKDCIYEKLSANEMLISHLVVHNRDQINKFRERQKIRKEKQEKKEQELKEKELQQKAKEQTIHEEAVAEEQSEAEVKKEVVETVVIERSRRTRKKKVALLDEINDEQEKAHVKQAEDRKEKPAEKQQLVEEEEPLPYFSALTFKLSNVNERYDPIFFNSFDDQEKVRAKMEEIIKDGIRVPKHYVWYAVDAYEDEDLAENLRHALYLIENPPKGKYRKRTTEEKPILPSDNKRIKT